MPKYNHNQFRPVLIYNGLLSFADYTDWLFKPSYGKPYTPFNYETVLMRTPKGYVINRGLIMRLRPIDAQLN